MALFKISKGVSSNLPTSYKEGYCYFTTDDGKMYIDTTNDMNGRVCLNANTADKLKTAKTITLQGGVIGSVDFDGSKNVIITTIVEDDSHDHTITAESVHDDVVTLTGTNGTNKVKYEISHAKKGPSEGYTSGNTTTSISSSGTIKIPQITVDDYGHVTAAADEDVTITMPTIPTLSGGSASTADATVVGGVTVNGHAVTVGKKTLTAGPNVTITGTENDITITSTNTDTKVTAVENHYTPVTDTNYTLSIDASSTTAASWSNTNLVTGIDIQRDMKGHVTGITVDSIQMPANPNIDTKVKQTITSSDKSYPLLLAPANQGATTTTSAYFDSGVTLNPSTNTIAADISGNAATADKADTADKLTTARTITLQGDVIGSESFDGSEDITIDSSLATTGVSAGFYGLNKDTKGSNGTEIAIPYLKIDSDGRISEASNKKYTAVNTDEKVKQILTDEDNSNTYPLLFTSTANLEATTTGHTYFDSGVTLQPSTNTIAANISGNAATATKWKTARNFSIADSDATNTGTAVSVNGSAAVTLKLPSTIKASISGNATSATKLATARTIRTNLASTSTASFNGTANITPGVTGTLGPGNGGTGETSLNAACNSLINGLTTGSSTPSDADYYVSQYAGGGTTTTTYHRRPVSSLWNYMRGKADTRYLQLSGGTMSGSIHISHDTSATMDSTTTNPRITFSENGVQEVGLVYTDYNSYRSPAGLKVVGIGSESSPAWFEAEGNIYGSKVYGAVWNDYAEYRNQQEEIKPGYCVASTNNGKVYKTIEMYQACDGIVSDTFGFAIGETDDCKTPLAVAGRVLAYCDGDRNNYQSGDTVCAGPNGLVYKMTRKEIKEYPDRIVGIVSEIPEYETWGAGNVKVDNRIWIKVK